MANSAIVLIDMDGPLCKWVEAAVNQYSLRFPHLPITKVEDVKTFPLEDSWPDSLGCKAALREVLNSPSFYRNLEPQDGAIEALKEIQKVSEETGLITPFICSSPWLHGTELDCHSDKARWVEEHLGRYWTERMILTRDKTLVRGHVLIDDKPDIKGATSPTWQQLLFDCNWNRDSDLPRFKWSDWPQLQASLLAATVFN
ncbi:MAG TPA: hypothetical protein VFM18_00645 [Methanosarcina sp.]|nr:hypothetical protein [Methanosarcina sp.]